MEKFNCIIVEDEPLAAEVLQDYVAQVSFLQCRQVCSDAIFAMEFLQQEKIDVIFLDIHLPRLRGLDFIKTLPHPPQIIITTAYRDYAIEGYELCVVDYLLKPVSFNRFLMAINKLKHSSAAAIPFTVATTATPEKPHLFINVNKKKVKIDIADILYIESRKEYISIVTKEKSLLTKMPLGEMETQLEKNNFIRVHRSFIVAKEKISAFTATDLEIGKQLIPIGRSYKELVLAVLGTTG